MIKQNDKIMELQVWLQMFKMKGLPHGSSFA